MVLVRRLQIWGPVPSVPLFLTHCDVGPKCKVVRTASFISESHIDSAAMCVQCSTRSPYRVRGKAVCAHADDPEGRIRATGT